MAAVCLLSARSRDVHAAAEVHRLNLVFSGIPTSVSASDFNERIGNFNRIYLAANGLEGLDRIHTAWLFDTQILYFLRPNIAIEAGVGQLRQQTKREFLPALNADVQLRTEILSVPIHVGGAYYLQPYNVGDFRAQAYFGGGMLSGVYNRARMQSVATGVDSAIAVQANFKVVARGDSPGYYVDAGVHMFFAVRFSVLISALYRRQVVRDLQGFVEVNGQLIPVGDLGAFPPQFPLGGMHEFDLSGIGARLAFAIGL
jgi:hypothetical protein